MVIRQKIRTMGLMMALPVLMMTSALSALAISSQPTSQETAHENAADRQSPAAAPVILAQTNATATVRATRTAVATPTRTPNATPTRAANATPTRTVAITATNTTTTTDGLTTTLPLTDVASVTATTLGIPANIMSGTLPDRLLTLMEPVTRETPTAAMQEVLNALASFEAPPIPEHSARNARKFPGPKDAVMAVLVNRGESVAPEPVGDISHRVIPSSAPDGTLLRILTPAGTGPFPVVVYFHGGGWVIAGLDAYEASARALVNAADAIVVMVAYRQAPEERYPAALEDSFAAYQWVLNNAAAINGDPTRVAVVGESAGGNLATGVALVARDRGEQVPVYQVLVYPITQLVSDQTPSYDTYADAVPLSRAAMQWFAVRAVPEAGAVFDPYLSPLLMSDLSGLPPATLITAAIDPLQSDGAAYAAQLQAAGVSVVYQNFAGVTHEFFGMGAVVPEARDAVALAADGLRSAFGNETSAGANATTTLTATNTLTGTGTITNGIDITTTSNISR